MTKEFFEKVTEQDLRIALIVNRKADFIAISTDVNLTEDELTILLNIWDIDEIDDILSLIFQDNALKIIDNEDFPNILMYRDIKLNDEQLDVFFENYKLINLCIDYINYIFAKEIQELDKISQWLDFLGEPYSNLTIGNRQPVNLDLNSRNKQLVINLINIGIISSFQEKNTLKIYNKRK